MTNKSTLECADGVRPQTSPSQVGGAQEDQAEMIRAPEVLTGNIANSSRRSGLSKREIMEELSRQRFPWEE